LKNYTGHTPRASHFCHFAICSYKDCAPAELHFESWNQMGALLEVKNLKVHFPVKHGMCSRVRKFHVFKLRQERNFCRKFPDCEKLRRNGIF
jgi:hypothetical protein